MEAESASFEVPEFREILTDRLRLRTIRVTGAEAMMPILTQDEVMRWTSHGIVSTTSQADGWLQDRSLGKNVFNFAIELKDDVAKAARSSPIIGVIGTFHLPEVGYYHAGKGYATEALQALVPHIFDRFPSTSEDGAGIEYVEGVTYPHNKASCRVLEKCGFTYCATVPYPESGIPESSEIVVYRKARPGKTLEELGLLPTKMAEDRSAAPTPPVQ